ncbi:GntR family transcriptional regulator [Peptoniphilus vaginalis]|uniref:GntR family transcriptional regulator n=1 Tax=Peptoniphilus vaginalis TaxID=1756987 RepID=UPI000A26C243|nr:GntR family transcriptional regulator [Peptoniphilus vaginalis]
MTSIVKGKYNKKQTLSDKAYFYLRDLIVSGEVKGGELLTEKKIGEKLNMSRTPVKRALTRLEQEGYVKSVDGVGNIVRELSVKDLADIYELRIALEKIAIKSSINNISDLEICSLEKDLKDILEKKQNLESISSEYLTRKDEEIHMLILANSTNDYIKGIYSNIKSQIDRYQKEAYTLTDTTVESTEYHLEILDAIKRKNLEETIKILEDHLKWSYDVLVKEFIKL